ncbi:IS481 family transposase [Micrococcus luteus]|uniref:IS481 family transposase n=2 Tax=Micrococcus luteus TaxID=1270 RepID=UPI001A95CD1C|nr:IS481 family transposase [Micrococcus luteus]MBO1029331.1 IS481 family transposase [Micrococcus luteus]MCV7491465.1 IS481 family transposase [Micrococcus luteus]MCV7552408.1 IS481 family transposase [Micrococcus luteus]MCV7749943.1 IS481 family transposase [Micrococcus luteus]
MTHANAPLTPTGRLRMVHRHLHDGIPQAHVAAEFRVSRPTVATWVARYRAQGEAGLQDLPSRPHRSPAQLDPVLVAQIHALRRERKWSARRIHHHLVSEGHRVCLRTVGRWLHRLGISRLRDLTPAGEDLRQRPQKITARGPGHMVHLDVKKIGKIPDGGGWRTHGRDSEAGRASKRGPGRRVGYTYLHSAIDGFTRLAYTEALEDERTVTTIGFFCRARAFFAAHGITVDRVITDNGNNYRAADFTAKVVSLGGRHHRIRPYTPRHNGKVERYNRLMVDEVIYARPYSSEQARREALAVWVNHYNYHRPHTSCGDAPPASLAPTRVNNVMPSYS